MYDLKKNIINVSRQNSADFALIKLQVGNLLSMFNAMQTPFFVYYTLKRQKNQENRRNWNYVCVKIGCQVDTVTIWKFIVFIKPNIQNALVYKD